MDATLLFVTFGNCNNPMGETGRREDWCGGILTWPVCFSEREYTGKQWEFIGVEAL